ncbi:MAG: hypothetical protein ACREP7_10325 [Lysobacter sp.]
MLAFLMLITPMTAVPQSLGPMPGPVGWYLPLKPVRNDRLRMADPVAQWDEPGPPLPLEASPDAALLPLGGVMLTWLPPQVLAELPPLPAPPDAMDYDDPLTWADPLARFESVDEAWRRLEQTSSEPAPAPGQHLAFRCPPLPTDSGLRWRHERGPDFDVCYADRDDASQDSHDASPLGLYAGMHPDFKPASREIVGESRINGRPVRWFDRIEGGRYARETLFSSHGAGTGSTFHVWIDAKSEHELSDTLRLVSRLPLE